MRILRIFVFDVIAPALIVGWWLYRYPDTLDKSIRWICLAVALHLTWEIIESERIKNYIVTAKARIGAMAWVIAFVVGGLLAVTYLFGIQKGLDKLAQAHNGNAPLIASTAAPPTSQAVPAKPPQPESTPPVKPPPAASVSPVKAAQSQSSVASIPAKCKDGTIGFSGSLHGKTTINGSTSIGADCGFVLPGPDNTVNNSVAIAPGAVTPPSPTDQKLDEVIQLLKTENAKKEFLDEFPQGYAIFDVDLVTGATTPIDVPTLPDGYEYDFRPVRILENTPTSISIRLPDLYRNQVLLITGGTISGDKKTMRDYGSGYSVGHNGEELMATGQVLQYIGDRVIWIFGVSRFPIPTQQARPVAP